MPLNNASLKTAIQDMATNYPATAAAGAAALSSAYATYAQGALSCGGGAPVPASITAAQATLTTALTAAFGNTVAASTAAAMASAFTAFWLTPPVAFVGAPPGAVIAVGGTAALQAALISQWAANIASGASASDAAQGMADALDIFTKTVVAMHGAPITCTAPIV